MGGGMPPMGGGGGGGGGLPPGIPPGMIPPGMEGMARQMMNNPAMMQQFQQMMGGRLAQMLRVALDEGMPCVPEVSANKYALNIRFAHAQGMERGRTFESDVTVELTFCNL